MATLTAVICLFTIQAVVLVDNAAADPNIDINPIEISLGISSALDINCTFSLKNHPDMVALASLNLLRANASGQNFEELAVITEFTPDSVNLVTQEKVTATGVLSQTGESFLKVTWDFPTASQGGVYQCAAHGLDMLAHNVESTNISVVTVHQANLNDIFEKLRQLETDNKGMKNMISSLENNTSVLENKVSSLENTITFMENARASMEDHILSLEKAVTQLRNISGLEPLGFYKDKVYYVFKEDFQDIKESAAVCESYGGTLIEINDKNEYNAVLGFLQNINSDIQFVMIGGTDEQSEGNWILPSTNQTLPFTDWHTGYPRDSTSFNCLGLYVSYSWQMYDDICHWSSPVAGWRASCEIPSVRNTGHK